MGNEAQYQEVDDAIRKSDSANHDIPGRNIGIDRTFVEALDACGNVDQRQNEHDQHWQSKEQDGFDPGLVRDEMKSDEIKVGLDSAFKLRSLPFPFLCRMFWNICLSDRVGSALAIFSIFCRESILASSILCSAWASLKKLKKHQVKFSSLAKRSSSSTFATARFKTTISNVTAFINRHFHKSFNWKSRLSFSFFVELFWNQKMWIEKLKHKQDFQGSLNPKIRLKLHDCTIQLGALSQRLKRFVW